MSVGAMMCIRSQSCWAAESIATLAAPSPLITRNSSGGKHALPSSREASAGRRSVLMLSWKP
jgi:hypothetical protein